VAPEPPAVPGARRLALFLSNGGSLVRWREEGLISRELLLYLEYLRADVFSEILIYSYDARDVELVRQMADEDAVAARLRVLAPPGRRRLRGAPAAVYGVCGVLWHAGALRQAQWFKTNQISGSWAAVLASAVLRRPLLLRMGYVLSRRFRLNGQATKARLAGGLERIACQIAARVAVTSEDAKAGLSSIPGIDGKLQLLPTYVDVHRFRAKEAYDFTQPMVYVGRLEPQKNIVELVRACLRAGRSIDLIGVGSLEDEVRRMAAAAPAGGAQVRLLGRMPNEVLAERLRDYAVFILPSLHEGLPKVLIEAMATGLICIGTPTAGTTDLIEDGVCGYLVDGFSEDRIADKIRQAFGERRTELGAAARLKVEDSFSLARYVKSEASLMRDSMPQR
jgi:glycosyltransferase involved in cell wall biosynthesis